MNRRKTFGLLGAAGAAALVPAGRTDAQPAPWPSRPIRLISPYPPGGSNDRVARMLAEPLTRALGQPVVVENRAGVLANSPPDGYTFLYAAPAQLTTTPVLVRDLPYDAERDFAPVGLTTITAYAFAVRSDSPVRSMAELIAQAKARPGAVSYATSGIAGGGHLSAELLRLMTGAEMTHIPYRGSGPAVQDVLAGQVPVSADSLDTLLIQARQGAMRILAVTSARRSPQLPDVPAVAEMLPGYEVVLFNYVITRAGTPRPIVERMSRELAAIVHGPGFAARNAELGMVPVGSTPEELGRVLREELAKWRDAIPRAGIHME